MRNVEPWSALQVGYFCADPADTAFSPGRAAKAEQLKRLLRAAGALVDTISTWSPPPQGRKKRPLTGGVLRRLSRSLDIARRIRKNSASMELLALYNCYFADLVAVAPALWGGEQRVPLLIQLEDGCGARTANSGWKLPLEELATRLLLQRADLVLTPTQELWDALPRRLRKDAGRQAWFPPALSQEYLAAVADRAVPFSGDRWRLMYAGGYAPEKGTEQLLRTFLEASHPRLELHLYGGPYPPELKQLAKVVVHGSVSPVELAQAYAKADICINPHQKIREPSYVFPCKNIEVLASGALPLFSSYCHARQLGAPDQVIYQSEQELKTIISNPFQVYRQMSDEIDGISHAFRKKYSEASVANQLIEAVKAVARA